MRIGIQVSSSLKNRTGVEEYIYQLLQHLPAIDDYKNHQFFIFSREKLAWPLKIGWTQIRLSWAMLNNKLDVLFVPAHTFPLIRPKKLVITIQGLEYERAHEYYSWRQRIKLRYLTKRNARRADKIIVPSECTKKDLVEIYNINPKKIFVVYHGVSEPDIQNMGQRKSRSKYILYLGSNHKRKNVEGLKKAFDILNQKYQLPHKLVLAGIDKHVSESEKWRLLKDADLFVFPSFYEGFGFPVLEAQAAGIPVIASRNSSLPEILKNSAILINPENHQQIAEEVYKLITNSDLKQLLIKKGKQNIKRFCWKNCAQKTLKILCE